MSALPASDPITVVHLPAVLGLEEAEPLAAKIRALRGKPLILNASGVEHLGGLCLQVLLSAQLSWGADNLSMEIADPSAAFIDGLALFGASLPHPR